MRKVSEGPRYVRESAEDRRRQLVAAAIRCLARGGIAGFTVDNVSREAGVSRGLIGHHFGGITELLTAAYEAMTAKMLRSGERGAVADAEPEAALASIVKVMFEPPMFSKSSLRAWLALWGEVATNRKLKLAHRRAYDSYRGAMADAIAGVAAERRIEVNATALAAASIALNDGLWIEWCLDSTVMSREAAAAAVYDLLEARLGSMPRLRRSM